MGCKSSKTQYNDMAYSDGRIATEEPLLSQKKQAAAEGVPTQQPQVPKGPPSLILYKLLFKAQQYQLQQSAGNLSSSDETTTDLWSQVVKTCTRDPRTAYYVDKKTQTTPLHLVCMMIDYHANDDPSKNNTNVTIAMRSLIQACPDALSMEDARGNIPLHYAIAPPPKSRGKKPNDKKDDVSLSRWRDRASVLKLLIAADYETSNDYLNRNNVVYTEASGGCTPLYRALESIPDDFVSSGPTVDYIAVIQESSPRMVSVGNASDGDKPLALLYRRFTRQFDISEKFFAGDNSRPEVVRHRKQYKMAAGNTWKIIELLLRPETNNNSNDSNKWRIVHRAVQLDAPPDLLRYIVETNAEELTQVDHKGNLPLHYAAKSVHVSNTQDDTTSAFPQYYNKYVIDELLYKFPEGASIPDAQGKFPLTLAVDSGKQFIGGGVKSLYDAYPEAIHQTDLNEHPTLKAALSFEAASEAAASAEEADGVAAQGNQKDVTRDEQHDAIMLVQKKDASVSEVVTSMWAYEEDPGVQMLGCVAIAKMATAAADETTSVLRIALSSVAAVVNAMKAHPNEPIVQDKACAALKAMASADGYREVSFVALGAVAAIVGAMQAHVGDPMIQEEACGAIAEIVSQGGADRATIVASVSGFTALVNAIAAHPDVLGVQREGCRALMMLTEYPEANLPELPRSQTEPLLRAAMENFPEACGESADVVLARLS